MNEAELAKYCRQKGLYPEQLVQWRRACETANDWDREANRQLKSEQKADRKCIRAAKDASCSARKKRWPKPLPCWCCEKKAEAIWGEPEGE